MADLKVTFRAPPTQLSRTFTSSVSMMLQHWPTDVTGFGTFEPFGADGTAYDSQYPRHAFVFIENCTQSGISIVLLWPKNLKSFSNYGFSWENLNFRIMKDLIVWSRTYPLEKCRKKEIQSINFISEIKFKLGGENMFSKENKCRNTYQDDIQDVARKYPLK